MRHQTTPSAISVAVPRSAIGRRLVRARALLRRPSLDAALAEGADPWSSGELMARAVQLGALAHRRGLSAGVVALVEVAERQRSASPYLRVQHRAVLAQRDALLTLADHVGRLEPVDVALTAQLALLLSNPASPVFAGEDDPAALADVVARCLERVS